MPSDNISNIAIMGGGVYLPKKNSPPQYRDKQFQYYDPESARYTENYIQYSSDYFLAYVQGVNPDDFWAWEKHYLRLADVVNASATLTKQIDDYKMVLFQSPRINYIPRGTKIVTAGSTWLVTNPQNISGTSAGTIVERCNAVWNHLDYYGNILSEPLVVDRGLAKANTNDRQDLVLITEGYFSIKAQYNEWTSQLGQNSRIMLGSKAYAITGYTDFIQEFTGDYESVRIVEFNAHYEEPNAEIDDIPNHVAGGLTFSWEITVHGDPFVSAGNTTQLTASSERCGEPVDDSSIHPIASYKWVSNNPNAATVDDNGLVTGIANGIAPITCYLEQNPLIRQEFIILVTAPSAIPFVGFTSTVPEYLNAYDRVEISAAYYVNSQPTEDPIEWSFSGADESKYSVSTGGNQIRITCWGGDVVPLEITASCNGKSFTKEIYLRGV